MKRQTEIHENLMFMQKNEMKKLRDWMTDMEDRISQMGEILFSTIEDHVKDQSMLELDITEHQVSFSFYNFLRSWDFFLSFCQRLLLTILPFLISENCHNFI